MTGTAAEAEGGVRRGGGGAGYRFLQYPTIFGAVTPPEYTSGRRAEVARVGFHTPVWVSTNQRGMGSGECGVGENKLIILGPWVLMTLVWADGGGG